MQVSRPPRKPYNIKSCSYFTLLGIYSFLEVIYFDSLLLILPLTLQVKKKQKKQQLLKSCILQSIFNSTEGQGLQNIFCHYESEWIFNDQ